MKKSLAVMAGLALASTLAMGADLASNADYKAKCAVCHGANGEGKAALKTPPMKDAASKSEADLTTLITKGKAGTSMKGYEGKLSADQIKALVADIKALK